MDNLPVELVLMIVHKLPIKKIGQSMCVSKKWLSLIWNPRFISKHTKSNSDVARNQLVVYQASIEEISFNFDDPAVDSSKLLKVPFQLDHWYNFLSGICNGLFCIVDRQGAIVLWNPTIQKALTLPPPFSPADSSVKYEQFPGLAFDSLANDYKVVSYVKPINNFAAGPGYLQVFSLDKYSWRTDPIITPRYGFQRDSLSFNSVIHWIAADKNERFILGFDVSSELVQLMKFPQSVAKSKTFLKMSMYKDFTIGVCHCENARMVIWVMIKYINADSWNKMGTFNVECMSFQRIDHHPLSFCFRKSGELFLQVPGEHNQRFQRSIVLLDPQTGEKKVGRKDHGLFYGDVFSYFEESFVLVDHPFAESDTILRERERAEVEF